jgi:molybdopterin synthase catalytic subunit
VKHNSPASLFESAVSRKRRIEEAIVIRVQAEDFDCAAEIRALTAGRDDIGAVVSFTGLVRRGDAIRAMTLEHYPGMTEKELERIEAEAAARWPLSASTIIHRYGRLLPGDNIVLVVTASPHRQAAFEAAEFLMDYLKTSAPFWKKEEPQEGQGDWVNAKSADDNAALRWLESDDASK